MDAWTLQFLALCWAAFLLIIFAASFRVKRTVEHAGWGWRIVPIAFAAIVIVFVKSGRLPTAMPELWPRTLPIELLADALTALGLGILLWARFALGGNWSSEVVLKENHELIQRGPYHYVRHPLYSGLLLMTLGTMVWIGQPAGLVIFAVALLALWVKARQEEQLLTKQFPDAYPRYKAHVKALIPHVL